MSQELKKPNTMEKISETIGNNLTVIQLRAIAKERGLTGYTKLSKNDLIEFLNFSTTGTQERQKRNVAPEIKSSIDQMSKTPMEQRQKVKIPVKHKETPTLGDLLQFDHKPTKIFHQIQKDYTPEFLSLKKEGQPPYIRLSQLGKPGKEGTVYLVSHPTTMKSYAMKTFRKKKSGKTLEKEAYFQYLASMQGISPRIIEYNPVEKYIVMEALNRTLLDVIKTQGTLTVDQQRQIIQLYRQLDSIGVMLNDANPLNIMEKDGKLYTIDYGFAKFTDHKDFKDYPYPNFQLMPLGLLLWMKKRYPTKTWTVIRNAISPEVRMKMSVDEWV